MYSLVQNILVSYVTTNVQFANCKLLHNGQFQAITSVQFFCIYWSNLLFAFTCAKLLVQDVHNCGNYQIYAQCTNYCLVYKCWFQAFTHAQLLVLGITIAQFASLMNDMLALHNLQVCLHSQANKCFFQTSLLVAHIRLFLGIFWNHKCSCSITVYGLSTP